MICIKCDNDLASCTCPDLKERFERLLQSEHLYIGLDYRERIRAQIERNAQTEADRAKHKD